MAKPQRPLKPKPGRNPIKQPAPVYTGRIVLKEKEAKTIRLRLFGPTSFTEGRDLAADLNAVIAEYNTQYFIAPDGTPISPKISAKTDPPA